MQARTSIQLLYNYAKPSSRRRADTQFYDSPRFVTHIDDRAIEAITKYYDSQFPKDAAARESLAVLDMCSSWISHYPKGFSAGRVAGARTSSLFVNFFGGPPRVKKR